MTTLSDVEIGSVVYNLVQNIPTTISGATLTFLVDQSIYQAENWTGTDIPTTAVTEEFQPAIVNLTISQVLGQMEAQGLGTKAVSIGELSLTKGMQENSSVSFRQLAMQQLNNLGHKTSVYQTFS